MLTARTQDSDIKQGQKLGADVYMKKPFKSEEILSVIQNLLGITEVENNLNNKANDRKK